MDLDSSLQAFTLDHARICGVNKTFSRGSFRPLGETKLEIKMEKRFRVTHQFNYSVVHNLIGKVNKHVALSISAILQTALHFTGKSHKKVTFSPQSTRGRMFSRDNDRRETLEQYNSLREINRFLEFTLSSFCIFEKALFLDPRNSRLETRDSRLETRDSILDRFEHRGSSFECQLTFERYCSKLYLNRVAHSAIRLVSIGALYLKNSLHLELLKYLVKILLEF